MHRFCRTSMVRSIQSLVLNYEEIIMRKKIFLAVSMIMVLALAAVAFAYNQSATANTAKMDCCKSKDSCPMKNKSADGKTESCCDDANCCCKSGDSCPMKKGDAVKANHEMKDMNHEAAAGDNKNCDCSCCNKGEKAVS